MEVVGMGALPKVLFLVDFPGTPVMQTGGFFLESDTVLRVTKTIFASVDDRASMRISPLYTKWEDPCRVDVWLLGTVLDIYPVRTEQQQEPREPNPQ